MARGKYQKWLTPENLGVVKGWCRDGLTDEQIAHNMGVSVVTLYNWRGRFPQLQSAMSEGKEVADAVVENTLYKIINGYEYKETVITSDGEARQLTKYQHPNVTAVIFWLKNRLPEKWRDRKDVELSGEVRSIFEELAKK